jgi:hypothetical protein
VLLDGEPINEIEPGMGFGDVALALDVQRTATVEVVFGLGHIFAFAPLLIHCIRYSLR